MNAEDEKNMDKLETDIRAESEKQAIADRKFTDLQQPYSSNVEAFVTQAKRLYAQQHSHVAELESAHALDRAKLIDTFVRRMAGLERDMQEAVRDCDDRFRRQISEARRILDALTRMREV